MADKTVSISQQFSRPIKVLKWKVSEGNSLSIGRVILLYDFEGAIKCEQRKLKSTQAGTVRRLVVQEGAIVKKGELLVELSPCIHPTVMKDMCGECGADLRKDDSATTASVPMVHAIPELKVSEELAQKLGKADGDRLLKDRKLVLLVDLDQTLIHTTNDNIPPNIKDVYHFQLYGPNSPWYHTRLRPGTHQFLANISPMYELHICTFGARNYAHTITTFLDGDQRFFSNRILSRDECFDPTSKKANLKKLVPLVDLDQTLIHTTNNNIPPNIKDVYHFQVYGPNSPWYHTRLRPGTHQVLANISPMYKLHICTFGARNYAHTVTTFLDGDQRFFSNRILSRVECFNPTSKKANLKALFPCGDNMVCIIDDREDVWSHATNLIHVKPYHFFQHTGDINAPPGLDKQENDEKAGVDLTKIKITSTSNKKVNGNYVTPTENNDVSKTTSNGDQKIDEETNSTKNKETATNGDFKKDSEKNGNDKEEIKEDIETKCDVVNVNNKENNEESNEEKEKVNNDENEKVNNDETEKVNHDENEKVNNDENEKVNNDENEKINNEENEKINNEGTEKINNEENEKINNEENEKVNNDENKKENKDDNKKENNKQNEYLGNENQIDSDKEYKDLKEENVKFEKKSEMVEDLIEIDDPDDYLLYLEDILKNIHQTFYDEYDKLESGQVPDLKQVIPRVRCQVLKGCNLVFSGLVPTHLKLHDSKAYQVAKSLGAKITQDLQEDTTHLVAVRPGTAKVNAGRRRKNIKIVTSDWLWACAERWEHVEEIIFPLNSKGSKNRHPPPHCSSPEHVPNYPEGNQQRKRTSSGRFIDMIPTMMCFSSDDIADMGKEVDAFMDDDDESDSESEAENVKDVPKICVKKDEKESSSSDESLTGEYPKGFKRLRRQVDEEDKDPIDNDSSIDEFPSTRFRRGEKLDNSDLDLEDDTNSPGSDEAPDEVDDGDWNMMGAALEREFLSNN